MFKLSETQNCLLVGIAGLVIGFMVCKNMKSKEETSEGFWDGAFVDNTFLNVLIWIVVVVLGLAIVSTLFGFSFITGLNSVFN